MKSAPDAITAMRRLEAMLDTMRSAPATPAGIRTNHRVPYNRVFRQWDTRGRLWLWVHPGALYDALGPRVARTPPALSLPLTGIPIYES